MTVDERQRAIDRIDARTEEIRKKQATLRNQIESIKAGAPPTYEHWLSSYAGGVLPKTLPDVPGAWSPAPFAHPIHKVRTAQASWGEEGVEATGRQMQDLTAEINRLDDEEQQLTRIKNVTLLGK